MPENPKPPDGNGQVKIMCKPVTKAITPVIPNATGQRSWFSLFNPQ